MLNLRQELAHAQQHQALVNELRVLEFRLAELPPVAKADPQAEMVAGVLNWLSIAVSQHDIGQARLVLIVAVMELLAAIGLSAGLLVWRAAVFA